MVFDFFGEKKKVIIAMSHIGALPGSPGYDSAGGVDKLIDDVLSDIEKLQDGGVDAIMFGNENDRPYELKAPPEGIAAMTAIVQAAKPHLKVPFGVNYLWDPVASIAIGAATGASFVREIFTGVFASDMGVWAPDCASAARLRARLDRGNMKMLFNINAEFAHSLDQRPLELRARSAVFSSQADAILVSGPLTGQAVDQSGLRAVCDAVSDVPVFANTGVNKDNVADILSCASGVIIGTHFKHKGDTFNKVDPERVTRFMDIVNKIRN
ncbi:BtpA/SgcQ family protein [Roseibium aggregatum]|uniref:Putative sgc region protein SgcQ n=1 Tax=Roseibium aggregatum TaxID=187304 RepID=A0A0M6YBH0_9HYPH|nr:BtpA/SgcQ family protein [Roseibium aggregatum]CTQ47436.1 Putative sgc region protein SgcQ [Roseibium aggregatum]